MLCGVLGARQLAVLKLRLQINEPGIERRALVLEVIRQREAQARQVRISLHLASICLTFCGTGVLIRSRSSGVSGIRTSGIRRFAFAFASFISIRRAASRFAAFALGVFGQVNDFDFIIIVLAGGNHLIGLVQDGAFLGRQQRARVRQFSVLGGGVSFCHGVFLVVWKALTLPCWNRAWL